MALTNEQTAQLRAVVEERRGAILAELHKDITRTREEPFGDLAGPAPDTGDESVATLIADLDQAEVSRDVDELRALDKARERFAEGSYGICANCGSDIEYGRLRANPSALRCLDCQRLYEKTFAQPMGPSSSL